MKRLPLVSIITPSYNQGEFIEDAILSVKSQRYQQIEHIIVDGASTDNTLDIIKKYEGTYNMRWISEPDDGPVQANNKGLRMAQGEYFGFLCTDDLYFPWSVSITVEHLRLHPEVEVVYGDMLSTVLEEGRNWLIFPPYMDFPLLRKRALPTIVAVLFRMSMLDKVGLLDETWGLIGEREYVTRVNQQCAVSRIDEVLYVDRMGLQSIRVHKKSKLIEEGQLRQINLPKGLTGFLHRLDDLLVFSVVKKLLRLKFAYYYLTRNRLLPSKGRPTYPWQNFIESSGIHGVSWFTFLATTIPGARYFKFILKILPWARRRYKGRWFVYNTAKVCIKNEDRGEDN